MRFVAFFLDRTDNHASHSSRSNSSTLFFFRAIMLEGKEEDATVNQSGIYRVVHDPVHLKEHEVTCVYGKKFPPCKNCGRHVRFVLERAAVHIENHKEFKG
jgi:hypothetical protein